MAEQNAGNPKRFKIRHIFLGLFLVLLGWLVVFRISAYRALNQRLEALRDQGYPLSMEELDRSYHGSFEGSNAADYYLTAFSHYTPDDDEAREGLPWVGKGDEPNRTDPLDPELRPRAEQFLASNAKTLELLHEAVTGGPCHYPFDFSQPDGPDTSWLGDVRKNAFLLSLEMQVACDNGNPNQALASIQAGLALARSIDSPMLICHLVRLAVHGLAYRNIERLLNRMTLTAEQLQAVSDWINLSDNTEGMKQAFVGERCFGLDAFRGSVNAFAGADGGVGGKLFMLVMIPRKILGFHDRDMLGYTNYMQDHIDLSDQPILQQLTQSKSLGEELGHSKRLGLFSRMMAPALARITELGVRGVAYRRVTLTALAIERYRLAESRIPQTLADLVPTYLEAMPEDPFDGQDLRYLQLDTGYVVYSVGDDLSDDGAAHRDDRKRNAEGNVVYDITCFVER